MSEQGIDIYMTQNYETDLTFEVCRRAKVCSLAGRSGGDKLTRASNRGQKKRRSTNDSRV